ncbi:hypothetical protein BS47DRAFT_1345099 [Hydnum rufescens UP504]|uniref:SWI5-dependent HO expression protein 3 n=1 Tax=Hydnum rufescens UP504 TaxID=1448309 RepID=A0A9P6DRX4_9AGAM|nr:hypothetical protein BS47DRAFT_1345099 [Hydnum rufescens UP504]
MEISQFRAPSAWMQSSQQASSSNSNSRPSSRASRLRAPSPVILSPVSSGGVNRRDSASTVNGSTTTPRPVSIIDDALSDGFSSPSSLMFDKRRSTAALVALAGENSMLPLPVTPNRDPPSTNGSQSFRSGGETIAEGIPSDYGSRETDIFMGKMSPTRTLSRIPVSSVGHARALAEENTTFESRSYNQDLEPNPPSSSGRHSLPVSGSPSTSNRRSMLITGGTTKVLADLQAGVVNARNALENTKSQLRLSQRTVAQLTRQTEDLKDGRERLRLENEGLNNVVARKERLLQEVLERARKAEAEAATLKTTLKTTSADTKKALRDMETALAQASLSSQKSEREYVTLKDSIKGMVEGWQREVKMLREDVRRKEDEWGKEREEVALKYKSLLKLQQATKAERQRLDGLKAESRALDTSFGSYYEKELAGLREEIAKNKDQTKVAERTAEEVAAELARIQRLMRQGKNGKITLAR